MNKVVGISFWENRDYGSLWSHNGGLTKEEIDMLRSLNVGDRLVIWKNEKKMDKHPDFTMKYATQGKPIKDKLKDTE